MSNKATIVPSDFRDLYHFILTSYTDETSPFVHAYKENEIYKLYMLFHGVTYCTRVSINDYLSIPWGFQKVIMLAEDM